MYSLAVGLAAALAVSPAAAFWRLPCKSPIVVERSDPIVQPGAVSNHLHTIMGGNAFDFTMDYNMTQKATCSSCTVIGDNSNYWTPTLFFRHQDGTFESVPQIGGATVYYLQRKGDGETLKAFPPGFRMVAGNPFKRTGGNDFATQAISYACLDYNGPAKPETPNFPNYNCPNGLRAQVFFPSCWNGKDLDTPDHKSHMSYPANSYNSGKCPPEFPIHLISIFFEIIWDTPKFANKWYGNEQPFVWSMGDPTGYGGHGDFIMGWDEEHLQKAVDQCTNDSGRVEDCPVFDLIPDSQAEGCRIDTGVKEQVSGILPALPGCNPVQPGPSASPQPNTCGATFEVSPRSGSFFKDLTSKGWGYTGCGTDNYYNRILTGASQSKDGMTNEMCVDFCTSKGFSIAGTEYSRECYCGNSIPDSGKPVDGVVGKCTMACDGDDSQMCGGAGAISLYTKCTGSECKNVQFGAGSGGSVSPPASSASASASAPASSPSAPASSAPSSSRAQAATTVATLVTTTRAAAATTSVPAANPPASSPTKSSTVPSSPSSSSTPSNPPTSGGPTSPVSSHEYLGCFVDTVNPRTLPQWSNFNGPKVTNGACIDFCTSRGFSIAGTEYAGQCFCGNQITTQKLDESKCNMACTGDKNQMCGGSAALSVYKKKSTAKRHGHARRHIEGSKL